MLQDIKLGWRRIVRAPGFAAVAVLSLAIPIGSTTALLSLLDGLTPRDAPYAEPDRLVDIRIFGLNNDFGALSQPVLRELEETAREAFAGVTGAMANRLHLSDGSGWHDSPHHELVAGPFFQVLGVDAQVGRVFRPDEGIEEGADPVVVLSDEYWHRRFDGDTAVVGRVLWLNGHPYTVVGVAAEGFSGLVRGLRSAFWAHASMAGQLSLYAPETLNSRFSNVLLVVGRMADGTTLADAETAVGKFAGDLAAAHPDIYRDPRFEVVPTVASAVHPTFTGVVAPVAKLAAGVLIVLLLLACLNLTSFLLARGEVRRPEIAVRLTLGTGRSRLIRSLLTETTMLALLGGGLGVPLSILILEAISGIGEQLQTSVAIDATLGLTGLLLALGMSVLAGLLMGLGLALQSTRDGISAILKQKGAGGALGAVRMRTALLVGQVALTAFLTVGAAGSLRSLVIAHRVDPGFGKHPIAVTLMAPQPSRPEDERRAFYEEYVRRVGEIPGVTSSGAASTLPLRLGTQTTMRLEIPGVDPPPGHDHILIDWTGVGGDFFDAMGIPLLAGRTFDSREAPGPINSVIISKAMAERFWPGKDPVGQRVIPCKGCSVTVVGVVGDTRSRTLLDPPRPMIYSFLGQSPYFHTFVVARTDGEPSRVIPAMIEAANDLDSLVITIRTATLEQYRSTSLIPLRISAVLVGAISLFSLLLAAIGLFGAVAHSVAARRRELAIRMSVGGDPSRVAALVVRSAIRLIAIGMTAGLLLAVVVASVFRDMPYGIRPLEPGDFAIAAALVAAVGVLAASLAGRRTRRMDPMRVLGEG